MGMSTHIVGYRHPDERWEQMKAVWDRCERLEIEPPREVLQFFDYIHPGDSLGKEVQLGEAVVSWSAEAADGYQVDLEKIPPDVKTLRFYNSY